MQGIITGIGNEITPEIDAVINDFIVGKNTILKGLELNGNILSAGTCILCGYRGTLENSQTVDGNYVYGKFVIGVNETDSFSIITSSNSTEPTDGIINPTSITSAGTYYLRLYANGASQVDSERYPKQADTSDSARDLIAGGTIDSTATTETASVNTHNTQPNRVANTEYVHNQIVKEIDYKESGTFNLTWTYPFGATQTYGTMSIKRRAKFCIATINFTRDVGTYGDTLVFEQTIPNGFIPKEPVIVSIATDKDSQEVGQIELYNQIRLINIPLTYGVDDSSQGVAYKGTYQIGYECE